MLKIPLLVSLGHHGGRRKVASLRPPFSTPLRSLGEPDPDTPFLVPIEHAPPLFVRIWEDKISLKIPPPPLCSSYWAQHAPIPRRSTAGSVYRRFYRRCGHFSGFTYVRVSRRLNRRSSEPPVEPAVQPPVVVLLTTNSLLIEKSSQNYCVTNMAICCTFPN